MMLRRLLPLGALALAGCAAFTGVDTTPTIKAPSGKNATATTAEQEFLSGVAGEPAADWKPGKRFVITDDRVRVLLGATAPAEPLAGVAVTLESIDTVTTISGTRAVALTWTDDAGHRMTHTTSMTPVRWQACAAPDVPFMVEQTVLDSVARRMLDKTFYVITSLWRDSLDVPVKGRKFIAVTITSVDAGTATNPVRIAFSAHDGASRGYLFLTPGQPKHATRTFDTFFSLANPREKHRDITDAHWLMIVNGTTEPGMTSGEVRLALGTPARIERYVAASSPCEDWFYDDGSHFTFENGILQ